MFFASTPAVQSGHQLAANLALAFPCNEASGTTVTDVKNGRVATFNGAAGFTGGSSAPVLNFPGTSADYLNLPAHTSFDWTGVSYSFACVLKPTNLGSSRVPVNRGGSGPQHFYLLINSSGVLYRWDGFNTNPNVLAAGVATPIVYTFSATSDTSGTETFYFGNTQVGQQTGTVPATSLLAMNFGAVPASLAYNGTMDMMAFWVGRVLNSSDVASYNADPGGVIRPTSGPPIPPSLLQQLHPSLMEGGLII